MCDVKPDVKKRAMTFEEFRKAKETSRKTTLPPSSSKSKKPKSVGKVKIQIGLKHYKEDESLKPLKGRTLPLTVDSDINASALLNQAVTKHSKHFKTFNCDVDYHLLYPDNTIVQYLRSSRDTFTLEKYKEELGKPYSKIYLYLCSVECFNRAESGLLPNISDDDDELDEMQQSVFEGCTSTNAHTPSVIKRKRSSSTQPSIVPILVDDNTSIQEPANQNTVVCPVCFNRFNANEIAQHADMCADLFDPVGNISDDNDKQNDDKEDELNDVLEISTDSAKLESKNANPTIKDIKEAILSKLCPNIDKDSTNRISVRRKCAFQDYVDARKKPRRQLKENATLKVTFIGEPAVDDGGPRREFFAGIYIYYLL